ncbi:hypothetical protein TNCV_608901 [Trichonephila clavipes]|nr:hypothetical protein TNCV_608901 [Trichonephila clavipes]
MITIRRHLYEQNIYGRAAIPKPFVIDVNAKRRLQWTGARLETPTQAYDRDCLLPVVKRGGESVMIWAVVSLFSAEPIVAQKRKDHWEV